MSKKINWRNLILEKATKDEITILTELPSKTKRDMKIEFICPCGNEYKKRAHLIVEQSGFYCKTCTYKRAKDKRNKTNLELYGVKNPFSNEDIKQKIKEVCLEKYGVENPMKNKEVRQKVEETILERYGVRYILQNEEIKKKKVETTLKRYNVEYASQNDEIKQKVRETCLKRYGGHPFSVEVCKQKRKETNIKKYGTPHPMQNLEFFNKHNKSCFKKKDYEFKTGEIVEIQGYEHFAISLLEEQGYTFRDIQIEGIRIPYKFDDKLRYHFPDIYIEKENRIIEVKSDYTYKVDLEKNLQKQKAAKDEKYIYEFWIFNKNGELVIK